MNYKGLITAAIAAVPLLVASQSWAASKVNLGSAGNFAILAESGISSTGTTSILGDIGVSPIAATAITGFGLILDGSGTFSTSSLVNGKVFASDYTAPTPANLTAAVSDMQAAYTNAAGRAPNVTELGSGNIGGMTLAPGVYKWGTGVTIPTDVTLSGGANAVWIFQIAGTLTVASGVEVVLAGGARPSNIFWQVAGTTTLGTTSRFKGVILDQTDIVMNTGATLDGRALAQTAVTLQSNTVNSQAVSALINNFYSIESKNDPINNTCEVGVNGGEFEAFGDVKGDGTAGQAVRIHYNAPNPTSTSRSESKVSVKQSKFSTLEFFFDGESATGGPVVVEQCSINGSADGAKLSGSVSANCKTDNVFALLTANQVASIRTAFNGNKDVKVNVNTNTLKGSLQIRCSGDASISD
jgi:hypothetical protein